MDIESALIILIMFLLCLIPMMILNQKKRAKERIFVQSLYNLAAQSHCKITAYDKLEHVVIGMDTTARRLFFIRDIEGIKSESEIDLSQVQKCRYINTNRSVTNKKSSQTIIEKLELEFLFNDPKKEEVTFEFYNSKYDSLSLRGEPELAEKWSALINEELTDLKIKK